MGNVLVTWSFTQNSKTQDRFFSPQKSSRLHWINTTYCFKSLDNSSYIYLRHSIAGTSTVHWNEPDNRHYSDTKHSFLTQQFTHYPQQTMHSFVATVFAVISTYSLKSILGHFPTLPHWPSVMIFSAANCHQATGTIATEASSSHSGKVLDLFTMARRLQTIGKEGERALSNVLVLQ